MSNRMTPDEIELARHVQKIDQGLAAGKEIFGALKITRDKNLFLEEHETFDEHCRAHYGFDAEYANKMIALFTEEL